VPFGQDRIVPIFLATLAVQQKSQIIRFKSASEMLEIFGMSKGGKQYRRLIAAFERIFGATIFFGTDTLTSKAKVVQRARFNFFREAQIWYKRALDQSVPATNFENVIVLSDEFFQEVMAHPIPADLEAVRLLSAAPAILDLFVWLSYRCFTCKGKESIPIFGNFGWSDRLDQWSTRAHGDFGKNLIRTCFWRRPQAGFGGPTQNLAGCRLTGCRAR